MDYDSNLYQFPSMKNLQKQKNNYINLYNINRTIFVYLSLFDQLFSLQKGWLVALKTKSTGIEPSGPFALGHRQEHPGPPSGRSSKRPGHKGSESAVRPERMSMSPDWDLDPAFSLSHCRRRISSCSILWRWMPILHSRASLSSQLQKVEGGDSGEARQLPMFLVWNAEYDWSSESGSSA